MKVVLMGYMGSGKSSVGIALAKHLGYNFIDLDEEISKRLGATIPSIFSDKGEIFFRKEEGKVLSDVLKNETHLVLALGGGTPCYGNNMKMVNEYAMHSFYLKLSIPNLVERLSKEKQSRPLIANISDIDLPEFIGKHLFERSPFYNLASKTIDANGMSIEEVIDKVLANLV